MTETEPHLEHRGQRPAVSVSTEATLAEWSDVNTIVGDLFAWLERAGEAPAGAPFYRYRVVGDETTPFELDVGVPTERRVSGDERVRPDSIPDGIYAVVVHEGTPDDLELAHEMLQAWLEERGHVIARSTDGDRTVWEGRYESFLTDPEAVPDRAQWSTEVAYLLADDFPAETAAPTRRALAGAGYSRLEHLAGVEEAEIEALHGIGPSVLETLRETLADEGLGFADGEATAPTSDGPCDAAIQTADATLTIRRTFDAPHERVWKAFTDPDELERWFAPGDLTPEIHTLEPEPGGPLSVSFLDDEDRTDIEGTYVEAVENERIVHTWNYPGEAERLVAFEFRDVDGGCEVVLTHDRIGPDRDHAAEENADLYEGGWASALEKLDAVVSRP